MKRISKIWLAIVVVVLHSAAVHAQSVYRLAPQQELKVTGTSTLHDWEMITKEATGQATIEVNGNKIASVGQLNVVFDIKTLKSGNSRMDRTAYDAIEADKHKQVKFVLTNVRNITDSQVVAEGNLTIGGQTRPVTLRTNYRVSGNNILFSAKEKIRFSQFDLKPPTALLGTVKTGDELEVSFEANFVRAAR